MAADPHKKSRLELVQSSYNFRPETDDWFQIATYNECDLCGEYDKDFSLITQQGIILTEISHLGRNQLYEFISSYCLCGTCSDNWNILSSRRLTHYYHIKEEDVPFPSCCAHGVKIVMAIESPVVKLAC